MTITEAIQGRPADVPVRAQEPFAPKQQHDHDAVDQARPYPREQDAPGAEHQQGEPDNVEGLAVAEHGHPRGGHRRVPEEKAGAGQEQRGPGQEPYDGPDSGQGWVAQADHNPDDQKDREGAQPYPAGHAGESRRSWEPVVIGGHLADRTPARAAKTVGPVSTVHVAGRLRGPIGARPGPLPPQPRRRRRSVSRWLCPRRAKSRARRR